MSDVESIPQGRKKARRNSSAEPTNRRELSRDTKRRRKRKKKAPVVNSASTKNEATHSRLSDRPRAPSSARNDTSRFSSGPSETDTRASTIPTTKQSLSSKPLSKPRQGSSQTLDDTPSQNKPPNYEQPNASTAGPLPGPSSNTLEERVAQLEAELKSKNDLIASHQVLLNQIQQAVTCQICLDLIYKPYALAPCGHLACHNCLVNWFTAPLADNRPALPAIRRRKTCPHCRAVVRDRPVEVWGVKGIAQAVGKSGLLQNQLSIPVETAESLDANADPWKDIFPKPGAATHNRFPWFVPGADVDANVIQGPPRGEDVGMLDMEDGGIYRCLDCMHEIWDGVCSSCGRVYLGHRPEFGEDDEAGDRMGLFEDRMGAEEVDVADDPGWMGLEDGEADDDGDMDDLPPFAPWRRQFHMFREPWGYLGMIHVDGEDEEREDEEEEDEMYGQVHDLRIADGSEDEGYESSFIDDDDYEGGDVDDPPRIYEIGNDAEDEDADYHPDERSGMDPGEEYDQERYSDVHERRHASVVVTSDEEADESQVPSWHARPRFECASDAYWSDE